MKDELRKVMLKKRADFSQRESADMRIFNFFFKELSGFDSFFIYNSYSSEADTKAIIKELLKGGKRVYLPRVEGDNIVAVPYGELVKGAFGIEEPCGQPYEGEIDVTVIPLTAVNKRGFRIGYGKGYYDRYLKDKRTLKAGIGYLFQLEEFEEDEWDVPLDMFICEEGIIKPQ